MFKKGYVAVVSAVLLVCVGLLTLQFQSIQRMEQEIADLTTRTENAQNELEWLRQEQKKAEDRLKELEKPGEKEPLVPSYLIQIESIDTQEKILHMKVDAELSVKNLSATAELVISQEGETLRFPLTQRADQPGWYQGTASVSLENAEDGIVFRVSAEESGENRWEELCSFARMTQMLDVRVLKSTGEYTYENGVLTLSDWDVQLLNAVPGSELLQVYHNGVLAQEIPMTGEPLQITQGCQPGDKVELRCTARDTWGLTYAFESAWWEIGEDDAWRHWPTTASPALVWPE